MVNKPWWSFHPLRIGLFPLPNGLKNVFFQCWSLTAGDPSPGMMILQGRQIPGCLLKVIWMWRFQFSPSFLKLPPTISPPNLLFFGSSFMVSAKKMIMLDECINDQCIYIFKTALNFVDFGHASSWIHCCRMLLLVVPRKLLWEPRRLSTTSCCDLAAQIVKQRIHHVCEFTPPNCILADGFKDFLCSSLFGKWKMIHLTNIFQMGWNHQPVLNF